MLRRVAGPASRRPLTVLLVALVSCAALATGFVRFNVDAGPSQLVGSNSDAGQASQHLVTSFGTEPIVVVLTAANPTAPYLETNLQRLTALEEDLAHDPRVAGVLGPGTVAASALAATTAEVTRTLGEYPYFVAESDYLVARQKGETDATKLRTQFQSDLANAQQLFELYIGKAAGDAHRARLAYAQKPIPAGDRILDSQERVVDAAVAADPLPPLFAEYLAGPGNNADSTVARNFFDRLTAAFGDCDNAIAQLLQVSPTCQIYLARILLDLPNCPTETEVQAANAQREERFCSPKSGWAAVLPAPSATGSGAPMAREVITVRLTSAAAADRGSVLAIRQKISDELSHGIATDSYTRGFAAARLTRLKQLGPLDPTDCGSVGRQANAGCYSTFDDRPFQSVIAGAPLVTAAVVDSMSQTLLILFVAAMVLMAILLVATFRARGRLWPLLAAFGAVGATAGVVLWLGVAVTPAVLAAIPVLAGVAVGCAVQVVARYDEARRSGEQREAAILDAAERSGPVTLTAAVATLAGLGTLMLVAGIDTGPFVAIPLVAEFALAVFAGVVLSWLAAMFIALPAAALVEGRRATSLEAPPPRRPERTLAIAASWRAAVVPAVIVAVIGFVLLPHVPVQTQGDQLLASSLPQLHDVNMVRDQTGFSDEVDILLQGQVAGPATPPGTPANVIWQCDVSQGIRSIHADQVAVATSMADLFIAASSSAAAPVGTPCAPPAPGGAAGTPTQVKTQSPFLCDLRLLSSLARNLVQSIASTTQPCPAVDKYLNSWLSTDRSPIDPTAARIAVGVVGSSIADEARLIDSIRTEIAGPPNGITAVPAGAAVLVAQAYDTILSRGLVLNLLVLVMVFLALLARERDLRRAALPLLPTAIAAGWAPLIPLLLGLLPGTVGTTLGSFNPLTVVVGALVIALATGFGVVVLHRFDERCAAGVDADDAAAAALAVTGRAVLVSALTLGAGFALLAVSALLPRGLPLLGAFGLTALIDLALAVAAVFGIMLPLAVAIERSRQRPEPVRARPTRSASAAKPVQKRRSRKPPGRGRS